MTDALEVDAEGAGRLLGDRPDFCVVGVVGAQGAGKSSLANILCHSPEGGAKRDPAFAVAARPV